MLLRILRITAKWLFRLTMFVVGIYIVCFLALVWLLNSPDVQSRLVPYITEELSSALGTRVELQSIRLALFDEVVLEGLKVHDKWGNIFIDVEEVSVGVLNLSLIDFLSNSDNPRKIGARMVRLTNPHITMIRNPNRVWNYSFLINKDSVTKQPSPINLTFDFPSIEIVSGELNYTDSAGNYQVELITQHNYFNYRRFHIRHIEFESSLFLNEDKFASLGIEHITADEEFSGLDLTKCEGILAGYVDSSCYAIPDFIPSVTFQNFFLTLNGTNLDFDLSLDNELLTTLFIKKNRNVDLNLRPSLVDLNVINYWIRRSTGLTNRILLEGRFVGDYHKLRSELARLKHPTGRTDLTFACQLSNYVNPDSLQLDIIFEPSVFSPSEAQTYLATNDSLPIMLFRYGDFAFHGSYTGTLANFSIEGVLQNGNGEVAANMNIILGNDLPSNVPNSVQSQYSGSFTTAQLNLDTLLARRVAKELNSFGQLTGAGITFDEFDLSGNVTIGNSLIYNYRIDSASAQISINDRVLKGHLHIQDKEGNFDGKVTYDLSSATPRYQAFGDIHQFNLHHYQLTKDTIVASALLNVDIQGDSLDVLNGYARAFLIRLDKPNFPRPLMLNNTMLNISTNGPRQKQINFSSDWFSLEANGEFSYVNTYKLFSTFLTEAEFFLLNDPMISNAYYSKYISINDSARLDFALTTRYIDDVTEFFIPQVRHIEIGSVMRGTLQLGAQNSFEVVCDFDSALVNDIGSTHIVADLKIQKSATKNELFGYGRLDIGSLALSPSFVLDNIVLRPRIIGGLVKYVVSGTQRKLNNRFNIRATTQYLDDFFVTQINADSSSIVIGDTVWNFAGNSTISFSANQQLLVNNFRLQHREETIDAIASINIPEIEAKPLTITLDNIDMEAVNDLVDSKTKFGGELNVELKILDLFRVPILSANGRIHQCSVDNILVGNLWTFSEYSNVTEKLKLQVLLYQNSVERLSIDGTFDPYDTLSPLNFRVSSNDLPLSLVEPFYRDYLYGVEGRLDIGRVFITGKLSAPSVRGLISLDKVKLGVRYFNRVFYIDDIIKLEDKKIVFNNLSIYDNPHTLGSTNSRQMIVNGDITVSSIYSVLFNLGFEINSNENFKILSTRREHNSSFYGVMNIESGRGTIVGDLAKIEIDAHIKPGRGTVINIPLESYTQGQRQEYIQFVGTTATSAVETALATGSKLDFQLTIEANPLAEVRLIFDEQAGDIISAKGTGNIEIEYLPSGELLMTGAYEVSEGDYLFTFKNIINKEFKIERGGTIAWSGDPYNAQLNLTAIYKRDVSLSSLDTTLSGSRPVEVLMAMSGELMHPNIDFRINIPNLSQDQSYRIVSKLAYIENDQAELNRQVFSLLLFNQFAPIGGFVADGTVGVGSSVSEFLSSQLNNMIGQSLRTDNLSIRLETAQEVVNLAFRLSLLDDRLTIERNGSIIGGNQNDISLGNISIQFRILPSQNARNRSSGVLVAEVFNRENVLSNSVVSSNRGLGLFYRQDFDQLAELLRRRKLVPEGPSAP